MNLSLSLSHSLTHTHKPLIFQMTRIIIHTKASLNLMFQDWGWSYYTTKAQFTSGELENSMLNSYLKINTLVKYPNQNKSNHSKWKQRCTCVWLLNLILIMLIWIFWVQWKILNSILKGKRAQTKSPTTKKIDLRANFWPVDCLGEFENNPKSILKDLISGWNAGLKRRSHTRQSLLIGWNNKTPRGLIFNNCR